MFMFAIRYFGYLLYNFRAGDSELVINLPGIRELPKSIDLSSNEFNGGGYLPTECARHGIGDNRCPSLKFIIIETKPEIKSLILSVKILMHQYSIQSCIY